MAEALVFLLASVLIVGVTTQWLAWRFSLPPILLMVAGGLIAGPASGILDPDLVLGDLLQPLVSLGVAVILFEGSMTLRWRELRGVGRVLLLLVSLGALITWIGVTLAAHLIAGLDLRVALLLGAILTVSGPTVVGPLLTHIRPMGKVASLLKWEGIVIDPIGALLAIFVFIGITAGAPGDAFFAVVSAVLVGVLVGVFAGVVAAVVLIVALMRYWVPDHLQNAVALGFVFAAFLVANAAQAEAGLVSVTVMGIIMANQTRAPVRSILEFKETLRVLIIPALFILLTARLTRAHVAYISAADLLFLFVLIVIVRPLSVLASTTGSTLRLKERVFLAGIMPRGVVAAAIASILALDLEGRGIPDADALVPLAFLVIIGCVLVYSLAGVPLARVLGITRQGTGAVLVIGAAAFPRAFARALVDAGFEVLLVDTNRANVTEANVAGLQVRQLDALSEAAEDSLDLERVDHVVAITPNDRINQLATMRYSEHVGRAEVFRVASSIETAPPTGWTGGRTLFAQEATWGELNRRIQQGQYIVRTKLTDRFTYAHWRAHHGPDALPLALVRDDGGLEVLATDARPEVRAGDLVLGLVPELGPEAGVGQEPQAGELAELVDPKAHQADRR